MSQTTMTYLLAVGENAGYLEEAFTDVLIQPEEGYYRSGDLKPFLPYRNSAGMPAAYYVDISGVERRQVDNLTQVRGLIYNEKGEQCCRIYKVGDIQLNPQRPVIGLRLLKEYVHAFIDNSRAWNCYDELRKVENLQKALISTLRDSVTDPYFKDIPTTSPEEQEVRNLLDTLRAQSVDRKLHVQEQGSLYDRFVQFLKLEYVENFNRALMREDPEHLKEVSMAYLTMKERIPHQEHPLVPLLNQVIRAGYCILEPLVRFILDNPWLEFSVEIRRDGDFAIRSLGDHRINQWTRDNTKRPLVL